MGVAPVLTSILMVGQLAVAGIIIALVATRMNNINVGVDLAHLSTKVTDTCLMGTTDKGVNLCYVAYGFSGVSVLATGALSLLLCCTCNLCGLGFLLDTIFALAGAAWWAIAGVVFNYYTKMPAVAALPKAETRGWIIILSWIGCALFAAAFLINLYRLMAGCCGGGGGKGSRDMESGGATRGPMYAEPVTSHWVASSGPPPGYPKAGRGRGKGDGGQGQFISGDMGNSAFWGTSATRY